ncbi:DUF6152 family protein [Aromatoleum bremense]|uniref:DNA-binding protein n=1 Tax=Aromatoleum bremense TaxID=76115 RepID=A0ABX1NX13_9RHOO|nr:DUF6152 family protein [Aromatoleum bremense]NMG16482.1 hypothetical protein [Aromatoleum bremense]QTQ31236.1 Uncharacterized protein pbN1_12440 [Aromatoleum bremense]
MRIRYPGLLTAFLAALAVAGPALAHHGWNWAEPGNSELTGVVKSVRLGNPHGRVTLDVSGEQWVAEVGQPWRNARAGLRDEMLVEGVRVTISGHRSARPGEKLIKAERVIIGDTTYDLYPDRD